MINTDFAQDQLNVCIVQSDIVWENRELNFKKYDSLIPENQNFDLIILPEMFSTGFSVSTAYFAEKNDGTSFKWMLDKAKSFKSAVVASIPIVENEMIFNRFFFVFPDGSFKYYNKSHLFTHGGEHLIFNSSHETVIINYKGWKIKPFVCYDLRFPVWNSNGFDNGTFNYDLAIYVANWPNARKHAWEILLQARAIENQCWVLAANRVGVDGKNIYHSGNSAIINPYGEIVHNAQEIETIITGKIDLNFLNLYRSKFSVANDWDKFILL